MSMKAFEIPVKLHAVPQLIRTIMFSVEQPITITYKHETGQVICTEACDLGTLLSELLGENN